MVSTDDRPTALIATPAADLYGSDRMLLETVDALQDAGWRVVVTTTVTGPLLDELAERGTEVVLSRTLVVRKRLMRPSGLVTLVVEFLRGLWAGRRIMRQVDPDVVYVSTVTIPVWLIVAKLCRRPSICHIHEGESAASPLVLKGLLAPLFLANRLLINSEFSRGVLRSAFRRLAERTQVVYNTVAGPPQGATAPRPTIEGTCRLVFVGRLSERKGPHVAVAALGCLREDGVDVSLDLVGAIFPGYEAYEADVRRQVAELGVADRVVFHGFQASIWPYLADGDIVLVPSTLPEPFGNIAIEAALAERPRVVSDHPGLREASDGMWAQVMVPPSDPEAMAEGVTKLIGEWDRLAGHLEHDREHAETAYAPGRYRGELLGVFNDLDGRAHSRRAIRH